MNGGLLTICEQKITREKSGVFSSTLTLSNYFFSKNHSVYALLIEGINQFAVRSAVIFSGERSMKFLPSFIRKISFSPSLSLKAFDFNRTLMIKGDLSVGNYDKSFLCTFSIDSGSEVLAEGEVFVSLIQDISVSDCSEKSCYDSLSKELNINLVELHQNNIRKNNSYSFGFSLNMEHPLFLEHFPGKPILPGSLIYDLVLGIIHKNIFSSFSTTLVSLKFILPISDSSLYSLEVIKKSETVFLFYIKENGSRCAVGEIKGILN